MKKIVKFVAPWLIALTIVTVVTWVAVFRPRIPVEIFWLAVSAEDVTMEDIAIARKAAKRIPASMAINVDGTERKLPLPNGATPYETKSPHHRSYMICTDALEPYLEDLVWLDFTLKEQMGSFYIYRNEKFGMDLHITKRQFSHAFYIVEFQIQKLNNTEAP